MENNKKPYKAVYSVSERGKDSGAWVTDNGMQHCGCRLNLFSDFKTFKVGERYKRCDLPKGAVYRLSLNHTAVRYVIYVSNSPKTHKLNIKYSRSVFTQSKTTDNVFRGKRLDLICCLDCFEKKHFSYVCSTADGTVVYLGYSDIDVNDNIVDINCNTDLHVYSMNTYLAGEPIV